MKFTKIHTAVCFVFLAFISQATFAEEFPAELRVVARCLADTLYPDRDEAVKAVKEPSQQAVRLEMQTAKFDLAKVKSDNAEIQHLAAEALAATSDAIKRLDTIDGLPKPNGWKLIGAGFLDGFLLGYGLPPTGTSIGAYQSENAKQEAIDSEIKGLVRAIKKEELAKHLLPRVAKPYAAAETKSKTENVSKLKYTNFLVWEMRSTLKIQVMNCVIVYLESKSQAKRAIQEQVSFSLKNLKEEKDFAAC
ncbi:MAG: hypothetical protein LBH00_00165 [Planctomycetaceae bacterium]|jgi:hypothetical protein|nr:hypothetical protein [Planctomycetaceae bacterium]